MYKGTIQVTKQDFHIFCNSVVIKYINFKNLNKPSTSNTLSNILYLLYDCMGFESNDFNYVWCMKCKILD